MRFLNSIPSDTLPGLTGREYGQRKTSTKRIGLFIFVIFLHAVIIYALATGLASKVVEVIPRPVEVRIIEEMTPTPEGAPPPRPRSRPPKPTPKPPKLAPKPPRPRPFVPPPEAAVRRPAPSPHAPLAETKAAPPPVPASPSPASEPAVQAPAASVDAEPVPHAPVRTAPVVDSRFCSKPEYPSASRRFEETGAVVLNFLIDTDGRVVQSRIESSSGYERLDEAARQALSLCRFKPGTADGKPEKSWHKLKYVWKLDDE